MSLTQNEYIFGGSLYTFIAGPDNVLKHFRPDGKREREKGKKKKKAVTGSVSEKIIK